MDHLWITCFRVVVESFYETRNFLFSSLHSAASSFTFIWYLFLFNSSIYKMTKKKSLSKGFLILSFIIKPLQHAELCRYAELKVENFLGEVSIWWLAFPLTRRLQPRGLIKKRLKTTTTKLKTKRNIKANIPNGAFMTRKEWNINKQKSKEKLKAVLEPFGVWFLWKSLLTRINDFYPRLCW